MRPRFYIIIGLALVVAGGAVYGTYTIPWFRFRDVAVSGNNLVSALEIRQALFALRTSKSNVLASLGGDHVLSWLWGREQELDIPEVRRATVAVDVLKRRMEVTVMERAPAGIFCTKEKICHVFDAEGVMFARAPSATGQLILRITEGEQAVEEPSWGERLFGSRDINNFSEVRETLVARGIAVREIRLRAAELNEWETLLADGKTLYFDRDFIPGDFGAVVDAFIAREDFARVRYFDFRVPNKIYFR